jgi:hypothetical protein
VEINPHEIVGTLSFVIERKYLKQILEEHSAAYVYFQVIELTDGRVALVVSDVSNCDYAYAQWKAGNA